MFNTSVTVIGSNVSLQRNTAISEHTVKHSFVTKKMASHGLFYWGIHLLLALAAAFIFELLTWHFHWFGH
jgi:hypothetical protein